MGLFDYITGHRREKWTIEQQHLKDKAELKLEFERRKKELEIGIAEKRQELERSRLDYQIREQQERFKEQFEEYDDEETQPTELEMLAPFLTEILNKNKVQSQTAGGSNGSSQKTLDTPIIPPAVSFNDDEIDEIYKALPQVYRSVAKQLSDDQIKNFVRSKYPTITEDCLNRAILRIKK